MLVAAWDAGAMASYLVGIEIDDAVARSCARRLDDVSCGTGTVYQGNVFTRRTWRNLEDRPWDLVITNPPYVRYQMATESSHGHIIIPSAMAIRRGLIDLVQNRQSLSLSEKTVIGTLCSGYSGLADMAVPSWLLCAALVGIGGRMAMVVPETWLSRKYAWPILYLLQRFFEIEMIVEDTQAAWFKDVLVRTNLVIARRVEDRGSAFVEEAREYLRVRLDARTISDNSLVGGLFPDSESPEKDFAESMWLLWSERQRQEEPGCSVSWVSTEIIRDILGGASSAEWMRVCEAGWERMSVRTGLHGSSVYVPSAVRSIVSGVTMNWRTLSDYGWTVGQGLRTGANRFFYGDSLGEEEATTLFQADTAITDASFPVPSSMLRPCIRRQKDLRSNYTVPADTKARALVLHGFALPEDLVQNELLLGRRVYDEIPELLASHIRRAAVTDIGSTGKPRLIATLSAVATNVRLIDATRPNRQPRFWYQLPKLTSRHIPAVLTPRVNHTHPRAIVNPTGLIVDANFVTLWPSGPASISEWAILAILNSTWYSVILEDGATVLGGGALKTEAADLRRLPLPVFAQQALDELTRLGMEVANLSGGLPRESIRRIDTIISASLFEGQADYASYGCLRLQQLNEALLRERLPRARRNVTVG